MIRSGGGWAVAKALCKVNALQKGDERILGDGGFVEAVLSEAKEAYEKKYRRRPMALIFTALRIILLRF